NQRPRLHRIVEVVAERSGDRFRHDDGTGKMDDCIDAAPPNRRLDQLLVANVADNKLRFRRNRPIKTRREPVDYNHVFARIKQAPDHMAADVPGSAGNEYRHVFDPSVWSAAT